ncbi:MAG TPA: ABC transporter substrate-binding protein [Ktedonosporobacter sp.]|nr:ABC transporter substrate-binding protein [Ktedonosporobacter sp.]
MQFSIRRTWSLLVCLLFVGLSIVGCGGSSSGPTSPAVNMTLKVGTIVDAIPFFPLYVAEQENYFKTQGLTLDPPTLPLLGSGAKLATAVEAGSLEVGVGALTDAFTMSRVDSYIRVAGAVTNDFLLDIVVTRQFEQQAHLTAASPLADKVKALVGKKVGISSPNSATDALVTYLFRQQGLDAQKDVTKVSVGAATAADLAALQSGRIDAVVVGAPGGVQAELQGIGDTFISPVRGDIPSMQGQLFGVIYLKQSVIDAKPKAVQAFVRAIAQAETFIQNNPDQVIVLLQKYLKLDQKTVSAAWSAAKPSMPLTPQISQQGYETANQFHVKAGLMAVSLAYNDLVATDTINKALIGS